MQMRMKRRSTRNPNVPGGTRRPIEALAHGVDHSLHVTPAEVAHMDQWVTAYHVQNGLEPASPWEVDPLTTAAQRAERARLVAPYAASALRTKYVAMRNATRAILGLPL